MSPVIELVRTNNPVLISRLEALLQGEGIDVFVLDANVSILEGSVGILPRRVMVADDHYNRARMAVFDAGLGGELERNAAS